VAASVLGIRSAYIYFILQRSCILFDAVCLANIRSPTPIQLLPPVHAPVTPTPPRAPSQTPLPPPSPVPASSPRLPSNKDTTEDKKTPDDSAPSHSSTPSAVPTSVTPLQGTRQVLASDPNPFEVPLPVLPFNLDMFSPTAPPATDIHRSLTPNVDYYPIFPVNHLVRSQARQLLFSGRMPLLPPAKRDWASVDEESIRLLHNFMWHSSMANTPCRLQTDGPSSHLPFFRQSQDLPPLLSVNRPTSNRHTSFLCCLAPPVSPLTPKGKLRHYLFESIIAIAKEKNHSSQEQQSLIVTLQNITPQLSTLLDRIKDVPIRL